jgi:hypothetical protein
MKAWGVDGLRCKTGNAGGSSVQDAIVTTREGRCWSTTTRKKQALIFISWQQAALEKFLESGICSSSKVENVSWNNKCVLYVVTCVVNQVLVLVWNLLAAQQAWTTQRWSTEIPAMQQRGSWEAGELVQRPRYTCMYSRFLAAPMHVVLFSFVPTPPEMRQQYLGHTDNRNVVAVRWKPTSPCKGTYMRLKQCASSTGCGQDADIQWKLGVGKRTIAERQCGVASVD